MVYVEVCVHACIYMCVCVCIHLLSIAWFCCPCAMVQVTLRSPFVQVDHNTLKLRVFLLSVNFLQLLFYAAFGTVWRTS